MPQLPAKPKPPSAHKGAFAEALVAQWLVGQGWKILARRWTCRLGELDLVAYRSPSAPNPSANLVFVEVKARSSGNWDADGLLAVNRQKQAKLWQAARLFLAAHPHLAELPCSFDVALVHCQREKSSQRGKSSPSENVQPVELGQAVAIGGYQLTLQHYILAAFDQEF